MPPRQNLSFAGVLGREKKGTRDTATSERTATIRIHSIGFANAFPNGLPIASYLPNRARPARAQPTQRAFGGASLAVERRRARGRASRLFRVRPRLRRKPS